MHAQLLQARSIATTSVTTQASSTNPRAAPSQARAAFTKRLDSLGLMAINRDVITHAEYQEHSWMMM
jgi:hypothetical protein